MVRHGLYPVGFGLIIVSLVACQPSATITCPQTQFDCAGTCLPFGSLCAPGADLGVSTDGPPMDPCAARAGKDGTALPVFSYCAADGQSRIYCMPMPAQAVPPGDVCSVIEDPDTAQWEALFSAPDALPCDGRDPPSCDQNTIVICDHLPSSTIGVQERTDCATELGWPDATCVAGVGGALPTCHAPEAVTCSDQTYSPTCAGDGYTRCDSGTVAKTPCDATEICFASRVDQHPLCLPSNAQSTGQPPSTSYEILGCTNSITVHARTNGYVFDRQCPVSSHLQARDAGVSTVTVQQICDPTQGCIDPP